MLGPLEGTPSLGKIQWNSSLRVILTIQCDGPGVIDVKGQHFQLLPFGTGRRGCPGLSLAMQEVLTILAVMIQCFDRRVISPSGVKTNVVDMIESPGLTIPRANDLVYVPVPRFSMNNVLNP